MDPKLYDWALYSATARTLPTPAAIVKVESASDVRKGGTIDKSLRVPFPVNNN
jgi:hypothetical protein